MTKSQKRSEFIYFRIGSVEFGRGWYRKGVKPKLFEIERCLNGCAIISFRYWYLTVLSQGCKNVPVDPKEPPNAA